MAPWADAVFAMDGVWWNMHGKEVAEKFQGIKATISNNARRYGAQRIMQSEVHRLETHGNSGAGAIALAALWGAKRILLLGYDCQRTYGLSHWHGAHPKGLGDAKSMPKWREQFKSLGRSLPRGLSVINCTRETALQVFPRGNLQECLS